MKHYDHIEWLLYKNEVLSEKQHDTMEEHLFNCDDCMEVFLSLIDESEIAAAGNVIPEDFNDKVIDRISKDKVKKLNPVNKKKSFNYQFGYYVAIASVTILLTLNGFYTGFVDSVPKITNVMRIPEERENVVFRFSERIVNGTSEFLVSIENINNN